MLRKYYKKDTLSTHRLIQKVATCQILSAKTKSIWQTSLSKFNSHFWKVRIKWINYLVLPKTALSPVTKINVMETNFPPRILSDGEFQLTEPRSAKILGKVVEKVQKCSLLVP